MSDIWGHFFASMGDHQASIVFDDGIANEINQIDLSLALRIKVILNSTDENGMPTTEEGQKLAALDEKIDDLINNAEGIYLGRVTSNKTRWVMALVKENSEPLIKDLARVAEEEGYKAEFYLDEDPNKDVYWQDLYPTEDDRRVMLDMAVLNTLLESGDNQEASRNVDHWCYFPSDEDANRFSAWLKTAGFANVLITEQKDENAQDKEWCVTFSHTGTMFLADITGHTLKISREIASYNGCYDGWETQIIEKSQTN